MLPAGSSRTVTLLGAFFGVFNSLWSNRSLVTQLVRRDFESRFRGSALGLVWAVLQPLCLLAVYTFVFSQVFKARWGADGGEPSSFALVLFAGLILFNLFSENLNKAPRLILQNPSFIKRVVFPLEVLPWVSLLSGLLTAAISAVLLLIFYWACFGAPPLASLYALALFLPLSLGTIGATWLLSSTGVFLRDLQHGTSLVTTVLMFLSPVFYPVSAVPEKFRPIIFLNPLTSIIEMSRAALFNGTPPPPVALAALVFASWVFAAFGYWWFMRLRRGFADVV